jgi:mannose-6-phosphate isomerase-like protein (cupin superfamily)
MSLVFESTDPAVGREYPPPVYTGSTGEISATVRKAHQRPELTYPTGNHVSYLAPGAATGGHFGLYRWDFGPRPTGPSPHFHRSFSESFFILSGAVRLYDGRAWTDAEAGDFHFVPEGGIHAFRNESGQPASMLLLFSPGAPREDYFETLAATAALGIAMTPQEKTEFYLKHDNHFL